MSQYSRIHQLQQRITELRMRGLEDRVEIRQLRNHVEEQKNALEAAQREIEALKQREASLIQRWNSSHMAQTQRELINSIVCMTAEERIKWFENAATGFSECSDYRQYESLSVHAAFAKTRTRR